MFKAKEEEMLAEMLEKDEQLEQYEVNRRGPQSGLCRPKLTETRPSLLVPTPLPDINAQQTQSRARRWKPKSRS